jgi:hypothetical protein
MSETLQIWLFAIMGAWIATLSGAVLKILLAQVKTQVAVDLFIDGLGEKLAKALHNDDDNLVIDALLDKYLDRHYELSYEEWIALKNRCNAILENKEVSKLERSLAGMLAGVCEHKITAKYGKLTLKIE